MLATPVLMYSDYSSNNCSILMTVIVEVRCTVKKDRYKLSYFTLITHVYQMIKHVIG